MIAFKHLTCSKEIREQRYIAYDLTRDLYYRDSTNKIDMPSHPISICIEMGTSCNLSCKVCVSNSTLRRPAQSKDDILLLLNWLQCCSPLRIVWSGGEPLTYKFLPEVLQESQSLGFHNIVATNLTLPDCLADFAGTFHYNVSIYGISRAEFLDYTGYDSFCLFERNFLNILQHEHLVSVSIRIQNDWHSYLPQYFDWLSRFPIKKIVLSNTKPYGRNLTDAKPATIADFRDIRIFASAQRLGCPIVIPSLETDKRINAGYAVLSPQSNNPFVLNGIIYNDLLSFEQDFRLLSLNNTKLFTLGSTIQA